MQQEYYDPWSNTKTKNGLDADLVISAMQKCIRRGEEDLAMRMAYELYITSTFHEEKMWNRLLVIPVEDIGFGDTQAPVLVKTMICTRSILIWMGTGRSFSFLLSGICAGARRRDLPIILRILL